MVRSRSIGLVIALLIPVRGDSAPCTYAAYRCSTLAYSRLNMECFFSRGVFHPAPCTRRSKIRSKKMTMIATTRTQKTQKNNRYLQKHQEEPTAVPHVVTQVIPSAANARGKLLLEINVNWRVFIRLSAIKRQKCDRTVPCIAEGYTAVVGAAFYLQHVQDTSVYEYVLTKRVL